MGKPVLLLTVKNNKNNRCVIEILNRIFIKDMNAKAEEIIKNNIVVYSDIISPRMAFGLVLSGPPTCVAKVFPIDLVINSSNEEEIISSVVKYVKEVALPFKTFYVDCYHRGVKVNCREIEIGVGLGLKDIAKVDFKNPDKVLVINVLERMSFLSIINKGQEKLSVNSLS